MKYNYEVLIVGGGPAGLTAALALGRIDRSVLVCDDNRPRNAPSQHMNNFPGADGINPAEWRKNVRADLEKYKKINFFEGGVKNIAKKENFFEVELSSDEIKIVKKIILAYGVQDRMLPIEGFERHWGKSIFHCPFCHGFEIRGSKLGIIAKNDLFAHALPMIESLSSDLVIFTDGNKEIPQVAKDFIKKKNIQVFDQKIESILETAGELKGLKLEDGAKITRDYLFYAAAMPFILKSDLGERLGCKVNQMGFYEVNEFGETNIPGVFAAGDNMSPGHSVLFAATSGAKAAHTAISQLLSE